MEKNMIQRFGFIVIGLMVFLLFVNYSGSKSITGFSIANQMRTPWLNSNPLTIIIVVFSIILFFFLVNRGNAKEMMKNLIGSVAIFIGLYAITKLAPTADLIVGLISLTFGIMAIFWTVKARNALSEKSSLRKYANISFFSLVCILVYSVYETIISMYGLSGTYMYPKYILISLAYLLFVYAAHTIDRIGKEFGFNDSDTTIRRIISGRKSKIK